jgi:hypothetical protein
MMDPPLPGSRLSCQGASGRCRSTRAEKQKRSARSGLARYTAVYDLISGWIAFVMGTRSFWIPVIASLIVTPIALFLGVGSAGAGHGDYRLAMMLFPYTMLSTFIFDSITIPFIVLAIIQFPLYGMALGYANQRGRIWRVTILLSVVHGLAWLAMSSLASTNFS